MRSRLGVVEKVLGVAILGSRCETDGVQVWRQWGGIQSRRQCRMVCSFELWVSKIRVMVQAFLQPSRRRTPPIHGEFESEGQTIGTSTFGHEVNQQRLPSRSRLHRQEARCGCPLGGCQIFGGIVEHTPSSWNGIFGWGPASSKAEESSKQSHTRPVWLILASTRKMSLYGELRWRSEKVYRSWNVPYYLYGTKYLQWLLWNTTDGESDL